MPCPPNGSLGVWGREVTVVSRHSESSTPALNVGSTKEVRFAVARLYGGQLQQARQQACCFFKLKISGHLTHLTSGGRGAASIETRYNLRGEFQIQRYIQCSTVDYSMYIGDYQPPPGDGDAWISKHIQWLSGKKCDLPVACSDGVHYCLTRKISVKRSVALEATSCRDESDAASGDYTLSTLSPQIYPVSSSPPPLERTTSMVSLS